MPSGDLEKYYLLTVLNSYCLIENQRFQSSKLMWNGGVENRIGDQIKDHCHLDNSIAVDEQLFLVFWIVMEEVIWVGNFQVHTNHLCVLELFSQL